MFNWMSRPAQREGRKGIRALAITLLFWSLAAPESRAFEQCSTQLNHPDPVIAYKVWQTCEAINWQRVRNGHGPLWLNRDFHLAAQNFAEVLRYTDTLSHTGPDGSQLPDRIRRAGMSMERPWPFQCGEVLAKGWGGPEGAVNFWMTSPTHRDQMLYPWYNQMGIGVAEPLWVVDFSN